MLKQKIADFLWRVEGRSYTTKSLSKVLNMKHETARKYLREMNSVGTVARVRQKRDGRTSYRYFV